MKTITTFLLKNWKTTLGGVLILVLTGLKADDKISTELFTTLVGVLTALGFAASKDADKKGV